MRILVIGGTYFLGKAFTELACPDNDIVLLNRGNRSADFSNPDNIKIVKSDRHCIDEHTAADLTCNKVFDVCVDFCAYEKGDILEILSAFEGNIRHYIFVSTSDVYKRGTKKVIDENSEYETVDFGSMAGSYILGKAALERELVSSCESKGITYNSIRPAFIYGPGNYADRESIFFNLAKKAGQVIVPENSDGRFQMVYVYDAANAILTLCNKAAAGEKETINKAFNITGNGIVTYDSFVDALTIATNIDVEKVCLPADYINERNIPLPFPMTEDESETYSSIYGDLLSIDYIPLKDGLKKTYEAWLEEKLVPTVDEFFENNDPHGAENYILSMRERARESGNYSLELTALNELIGYYRQKSEKEKLLEVINASLELLNKLNEGKTLRYATLSLNIANAYRSISMYDEADKYYDTTERIYTERIANGQLSGDDLRIAGLYNNESLLSQERGNYIEAERLLKKALSIVTEKKSEFEIAVTYANLANTCVLAKNYDSAKEYAHTAIRLFKAMALIDPHYCAALSALATCYYEAGDFIKAARIFKQAMDIVEDKIGKNSQYERLKDSLNKCNEKAGTHTSGMELSRKYYEAFGKQMISDKFKDYEDKIAVGLVGEGSDCFKYDDELSTDHDSGPAFCMWLTDETYAEIGDKLRDAYNELPKEFMGFKRNESAAGLNRRGVFKISDFYKKFIGTDNIKEINYQSVEDYALAACTNGEVFRDDEGIFSTVRASLQAGYPDKIRMMKIAEEAASFSQCAQYNYSRMLDREDELTAQLMLGDGMKHAMRLYHFICNSYPPHDKWLYKSTEDLDGGDTITLCIDQIMNRYNTATDKRSVTEAVEFLAGKLAKIMYDNNIISDIDPYLDFHAEELLIKASISDLTDEEIVDKIVRLEFETFDKVKNEGGRASCQNNWSTFNVMRRSQYLTWNRDMLLQYYYDFRRECNLGHNLITEKYGRMMESTDADAWNKIKNNFPELSEEKRAIIEQIVGIQMQMMEEFAQKHPKVAGNARTLHTADDTLYDTSYETYLRGEISTYSDKMLQLYGRFVAETYKNGGNIALNTMTNTAKIYGFKSLEEFENK